MSLNDEIGIACWFSVMSTDVKQSTAFYKQLCGYTIDEYEIPGMGKSEIYTANGCSFAGPVPLEADANMPSHWMTYFAVENVDAATKAVESLGGKVWYEPFDMPTIGRSSIVSDPAGAAFHLFTPENDHDKVGVIGNETGQVCWLELMVDDAEKVLPFYSELLNWTIQPSPMEGPKYYLCNSGEQQFAGIMERPADAPAMPAAWLPFITVADLEASTQLALDLGAKSIIGPQDIPQVGRFHLIQDPTGAMVYLFTHAA